MNPLDALSSAAKLIILGVCAAIAVAVFVGVRSLFDDRATVKEIKATTRALNKANKVADAEAAKRDAAADKAEATIARQIDAMKDSPDEALRTELARPLHPERVRWINCALRGPERESGCEPAAVH